MKYKTKVLVDRFAGIISQWAGVECIILNEAAMPDTLDPYFALILDVFYTGIIPGAEERCRQYGNDVAAFEVSNQGSKDRFLIGDIPVRLEYKSTQKTDEFVALADTNQESLWLIKHSGTYGYYRLAHGEILFCRNNWMQYIRKRLLSLDDTFWQVMRDTHQSKMEHLLGDLGAALLQEDGFNYLISSSLFIKTACLTLFCINRRFEPSHRGYYKQVLELPVLPESFRAEFEAFLSTGKEMTIERKYSLAQLIARGIVAL
jgi:hypothetical protein